MAYDVTLSDDYSVRSNYRLRLYVRRDQTDTANRRSSYFWELRAYWTSGTYSGTFATDPVYWSVWVAGENWTGSRGLDFRNGNPDNVISSGSTGWKQHDANGNLNIELTAYHGVLPQFGEASIPNYWMATDSVATVPPAPTGKPLLDITNTALTYDLDSNGTGGSAVTRWEYQYSTSSSFSSGNSVIFSGAVGGGGVYRITGLTPRTRYYVRSRGVNAVGTGAWSNIVNAVTLDEPDAPTLTLSSKTTTSINLTLADPVYTGGGISARQTQISTSSAFSSIISTSTASAPAFTGLTRGTTYYLRSRVQNSTGWGPYSPTLTTKTSIQVPSAPTGYGVTDLTSTTVYPSMPSVSDNGGGPLVDLRVQVNTVQSDTGGVFETAGGYYPPLITLLTPGTSYYLRVAVQNSGDGGGWSAYGPWVAFTTKSNVPTVPQSVTASSITDDSVLISWTAPANLLGSTILSYTVRIARTKSFGSAQQIQTTTDLSQPFTGLQAGTVHWIQVWANSNNGIGSYSTPTSFTTSGDSPVQPDIWQRISGTWRAGQLWLKVTGTWRQGVLWQRVGGTWRKR